MKSNSGKDQPSMFHPSIEAISTCDLSNAKATLMNEGYYIFEKFLTSDGTNFLLDEEITRLIGDASPSSQYGVFYNIDGNILVMNRLEKESDFLFDFSRHPNLMKIAEGFLGKSAMPLHVEYFSKPVESSTHSPPHQDHVVYNDHFDDELAIALWIALDEVCKESGALEFSSYSGMSLLPHKLSPSPDFEFELENVSDLAFTSAPVSRGGCIVHHSYAVHRAQKNKTRQPRRAIVFNYRGSSYKTWLQSKIA